MLKTCSRVFIILGDALVKTRARRDDARFLGRENTVPVRLVYRMDGDSQAAHDVLNTRVRLSSDRKQVCIFHLMFGCHLGVCLKDALSSRCHWRRALKDVYVFLFYSLSESYSRALGGLRAL